eukprot:7532616-Pyramimonas_sp.AAC.2
MVCANLLDLGAHVRRGVLAVGGVRKLMVAHALPEHVHVLRAAEDVRAVHVARAVDARVAVADQLLVPHQVLVHAEVQAPCTPGRFPT